MADKLLTSLATLGIVISPALLKLVEKDPDDPEVPTDSRARVECIDKNDAPIHERLEGTGDVIARLDEGTPVQILEETDNWQKIAFVEDGEARVGFVVDRHLEPCPEAPEHDGIRLQRAHRAADVPAGQPATGAYRVHLIDVGTGLSVLVQGHDFNLLFDGGSKDETKRGPANSRVVAYLHAALGPSGPEGCTPAGEPFEPSNGRELRIDHVFLSHPHSDHGSHLDDVLHCYEVPHVWDVGIVNPTRFYQELLQGVAAEPGVTYHAAIEEPADKRIVVRDGEEPVDLSDVEWERFAKGTEVALGPAAHFEVLHTDPGATSSLNDSSIVLRVELGKKSLLLTGDAEAGEREAPSSPPGHVEQELLSESKDRLDVDILQVGHHGSLTSNRLAFLRAVSPKWALVGAGPMKFGSVKLPDRDVLRALEHVMGGPFSDAHRRILLTDEHDRADIGGTCPASDPIGLDDPGEPGGCDNFILHIEG